MQFLTLKPLKLDITSSNDPQKNKAELLRDAQYRHLYQADEAMMSERQSAGNTIPVEYVSCFHPYLLIVYDVS